MKHAIGKLPLPDDPTVFVPEQRAKHDIDLLPIGELEALQVGKLPLLHRDPFDRILIAQAIAEGLVLVTNDSKIATYPVRVVW